MTSLQRLVLITSLFALAALTGCATTSVLQPYPAKLEGIKRQLDRERLDGVPSSLASGRDSADRILYLLESGRIMQITNNIDDSIRAFSEAREAIAALEQKAIISASGTGAQSAAILVNDNAIPYKGESYERIFLYHFQAMNYLFAGDLDRAMVEVRRANEEQQLAFVRHEKEIVAQQSANHSTVNRNRSVVAAYDDLRPITQRVRNSFQNAYTFYASGVLWELVGQPNDAYIDYKKALEIFPDNAFVQRDVLRLARQLSMEADLAQFEQQFPMTNVATTPDSGELIVFFEHGFAPVKHQIKLPVATRDGLLVAAFPTYPSSWYATPPLIIHHNKPSASLGRTQPIVYVQSLAAQALRENVPGILARQLLRTAAKHQASKQANDNLGPLGVFATLLFTVVTEQADLRSWLTLPNDVQIYRTELASGQHDLALSQGNVTGTVPVKIVSSKKTILRVIITGNSLYTNSIVM